jgi:hypothetical protein
MQNFVHRAQVDFSHAHTLEPLRATLRHRRTPREPAMRIHHKILGGVALLALLLAYDAASRIDDRVGCALPHRAVPLAINDTPGAMNRF